VLIYHALTSSLGKKKLRALEMDLRKLTSLRHPNVQSVYAVKMTISHRDGPSRLALLCEQHPRTTLYDVLADCDSLREERAADYLRQVLLALEAIHKAGQVHRGLSKDCIGLVTRSDAPGQKCVKVSKVSWFVSILALHKSNPIGGGVVSAPEPVIPDAWRHREAVASPLDYTRSRDIHCAGFVLLQMLLGMDVFQRFPSPSEALSYCKHIVSYIRFAC
jgi:translation initiation factor 2-alpha kinase 4